MLTSITPANPSITNDTTTNATRYLTWVTATSGNLPIYISSTKCTFNPSTGNLTSTLYNGFSLSSNNIYGSDSGSTDLTIYSGASGNSNLARIYFKRGDNNFTYGRIDQYGMAATSFTHINNINFKLTSDDSPEGLMLRSAGVISWSSTTAWHGSKDSSISRDTAGRLLIGDGSGSARDLKLRTIFSEATQTTLNGTTSGTAVCSQPEQGGSFKVVIIKCIALNGVTTSAYTFPTAFTTTPSIVATNDVAAGVITALSTTSVTLTGAPTTGSIMLIGY